MADHVLMSLPRLANLRPRIALCLATIFTFLVWPSTIAAADQAAAITTVIEHAYVQGVWIKRDPDLVREGFAPTFIMQVYRQGKLSHRSLDEWLERMKLDKVPNEKKVRAEISVLAETGDAAVARVELYVDSEHAFTDFFGLYRTAEGWKIVSKHYQSRR